jgi:hypothetical protein
VSGEADHTALTAYEPAWDEADEVIDVSIAVMGITERKQAEEAPKSLQESDAPRHLCGLGVVGGLAGSRTSE